MLHSEKQACFSSAVIINMLPNGDQRQWEGMREKLLTFSEVSKEEHMQRRRMEPQLCMQMGLGLIPCIIRQGCGALPVKVSKLSLFFYSACPSSIRHQKLQETSLEEERGLREEVWNLGFNN